MYSRPHKILIGTRRNIPFKKWPISIENRSTIPHNLIPQTIKYKITNA